MDVGNLVQLGAQLFQGQLDKNHDGQLGVTEIASALMSLMASNQSTQAQGGGLGGLGGLASMLTGLQGSSSNAASTGNADLMSILNSWISTGPNKPVSNTQLTQMLGQDQISAFAQQLGLNQDQALEGLKAAVPAMVDKATPTGMPLDLNSINSMLNSVGGISGAINMASKIFGR